MHSKSHMISFSSPCPQFSFSLYIPSVLFYFLKYTLSILNDHTAFSLLPSYILVSCFHSYCFALGLRGPLSTFSDVFLAHWGFYLSFYYHLCDQPEPCLGSPTDTLAICVINPDNQFLTNNPTDSTLSQELTLFLLPPYFLPIPLRRASTCWS